MYVWYVAAFDPSKVTRKKRSFLAKCVRSMPYVQRSLSHMGSTCQADASRWNNISGLCSLIFVRSIVRSNIGEWRQHSYDVFDVELISSPTTPKHVRLIGRTSAHVQHLLETGNEVSVPYAMSFRFSNTVVVGQSHVCLWLCLHNACECKHRSAIYNPLIMCNESKRTSESFLFGCINVSVDDSGK